MVEKNWYIRKMKYYKLVIIGRNRLNSYHAAVVATKVLAHSGVMLPRLEWSPVALAAHSQVEILAPICKIC